MGILVCGSRQLESEFRGLVFASSGQKSAKVRAAFAGQLDPIAVHATARGIVTGGEEFLHLAGRFRKYETLLIRRSSKSPARGGAMIITARPCLVANCENAQAFDHSSYRHSARREMLTAPACPTDRSEPLAVIHVN